MKQYLRDIRFLEYFGIAIVVFLVGCARPTPIPEPESPRAQLYAGRCGTCHSVPHPKRSRYEQWVHLMDVMEQQIEHRRMAPLSDEDREAILAYLRAHAR